MLNKTKAGRTETDLYQIKDLFRKTKLQKVNKFKGGALNELLRRLQLKKFKSGEIIQNAGEPAVGYYILIEGVISLHANHKIIRKNFSGAISSAFTFRDKKKKSALLIKKPNRQTTMRSPSDPNKTNLDETTNITSDFQPVVTSA